MTTQFNRTAIYISLGLSIALVFGVIFGAKFVFENTAKAPVAISPIKSDFADSPQCSGAVDALPSDFMGHPQAEVAEPVPAGVAAWASTSTDEVTLRCGVDLPLQYTSYSQPQDIDGSRWLEVSDMTPGSTLTTWYNTDHFPTLAVTTFDDARPSGLDSALDKLDSRSPSPAPAPLSQLAAGPDAMCSELEDNLPDSVADGYQRRTDINEKNTFVWSAPGREEIVVRCGIASPENYRAGVQLQQVNDVPWFEDTTLGEGTTAGTWFALGRADDLALHAPQDVAGSALVRLSDVLSAHTPAQEA